VAVNPDFRDLFAALNAAGAKYLLVGGYAVAFHAQPRFTKDPDIWTEPDAATAARVHEAPRRFGAPLHELTIADLVSFPEAWLGRTETTYGDEAVPVIGRGHLIRNKRASARWVRCTRTNMATTERRYSPP
jgi:hypothetical protein